MPNPDVVETLIALVQELDRGQAALLLEMGLAIARPFSASVDPTSDIVTPEFSTNFANRLKLHHATTEEKFKKKAFEFAFRAACRAAARDAELVSEDTNPGADVVVDGVRYSLKTEASKDIHRDRITISKLMEARWIRECRTGEDFSAGVRSHVAPHLERYDRVLTLRAFDAGGSVRYELVEIPITLLREVRSLESRDFSPRTPNGGSRANVVSGGVPAFGLRLDGSVEKVTISNLDARLCLTHATWTVPVTVTESEAPEESLELD